MNFKHIIKEIEQAETGLFEQADRRDALRSFGSKVALAAVPLALGSLFKKAEAQTTGDTVMQALNFCLEMEFFAYNFYHTGNNTGALVRDIDKASLNIVEDQKLAHIKYLMTAITNLGGVPYTPKNYDATAANPYYIHTGTYDFTAGGKWATFSDYPTFIALAEAFEDTILGGYKGELYAVLNDKNALEQMMRLQCANARHASHVRYIRRLLDYALAPEHPAPWITNNIPPLAGLQAFYNGEELQGQEGIDITTLPGTVPAASATAAFDEPKDKGSVLTLLAPFRIP